MLCGPVGVVSLAALLWRIYGLGLGRGEPLSLVLAGACIVGLGYAVFALLFLLSERRAGSDQ
jgi:hypothetical protein